MTEAYCNKSFAVNVVRCKITRSAVMYKYALSSPAAHLNASPFHFVKRKIDLSEMIFMIQYNKTVFKNIVFFSVLPVTTLYGSEGLQLFKSVITSRTAS